MLERKREGKTMIINIIYTVRMGVCSEVEGLNFLFVDNFPPAFSHHQEQLQILSAPEEMWPARARVRGAVPQGRGAR